jgi:hypothetical protein
MPKAASIFSETPMDLEAMNSQSELMSSKSFLQKTNSRGQLLASMDRSTASQEMVKNISARNMLREGLSRQGSGRSVTGGTKNATWGTDGTRKPSYRTSGILPKHASENHLMRQGSLSKSKNKIGSASRENSLYNLMKRNSSKNLLQRQESLSQLLPIKRRSAGVSKHKLGTSRSVPHLMVSNSNKGGASTNEYEKNAMW